MVRETDIIQKDVAFQNLSEVAAECQDIKLFQKIDILVHKVFPYKWCSETAATGKSKLPLFGCGFDGAGPSYTEYYLHIWTLSCFRHSNMPNTLSILTKIIFARKMIPGGELKRQIASNVERILEAGKMVLVAGKNPVGVQECQGTFMKEGPTDLSVHFCLALLVRPNISFPDGDDIINLELLFPVPNCEQHRLDILYGILLNSLI